MKKADYFSENEVDKEMGELNGLEIAVIGIGCRFPKCADKLDYWELLEKGETGITFFEEEELKRAGVNLGDIQNPNYVKAKGRLEDIESFDAEFFGYSEKEATYLNPQHRIILECAYNALLDGGYAENKRKLSIGVYSAEDTNTYMFDMMKDPEKMKDLSQIMMLNGSDYLATTISYKLNLTGQSVNVQCGCSSSMAAIHIACQALLSGDVDMALAGGVSVHLPNYSGYIYSPKGRFSPDGHVRALSEEAQGYVLSDGAGMVLLKRYEDAINDKDPIYCMIKASYMNNDGGVRQNYESPSEEGEYKAISNVFSIAEVDSTMVTYVEAHGTGTLIGDTVELSAWSRYFKKNSNLSKYCAMGSVDNNIGHTGAVSGVAKLIKIALMLKNKKLVKHIDCAKANPLIASPDSPFYINNQTRNWDVKGGVRCAVVGSFGIGGTNGILILEEAEPQKNEYTESIQVMPISAHTGFSAEQLRKNLAEYVAKCWSESEIYDLAVTYVKEAKQFRERDFVVYKDRENLLEKLGEDSGVGENSDLSSNSIVILFSGQGNQYAELGRDLYKNLPVFRKYYNECVKILKEDAGFDLFSYKSEKENIKEDFLYSQISIFVYQYSMYQTLAEFGVQVKYLVGHSLGEYVAACVANVFSLRDAIHLVYNRARLIEKTTDGDMIVVCKNEEEIIPYLNEEIAIAAVNDQFSVCLSGTAEAIGNLKAKLMSEAVACMEIGTKKALHSPIMREIAEEYRSILNSIQFHVPDKTWISTVDGKATGENVACPDYWISNLCCSVRFYDGIQYIKQNTDKPLYLEMGPGNALYSLLKTIHRKAVCYPILQSTIVKKGIPSLGKKVTVGEYESFLNTVAMLWKNMVINDLSWLYKEKETGKASMLPYPFDRKSYWYTDKFEDGHVRRSVPHKPLSEGTKEERFVANAWAKVLNHCEFQLDDAFFYVGGNSLKLVKLQTILEEEGIEISIENLYKMNTIRETASYVAENYSVEDRPFIETSGSAENSNEIMEGFNEFVYQNCFYNQLFAILKSYEINPMWILSNDVVIYRIDELLTVKYQPQREIAVVLKDCGFLFVVEKRTENVCERVKNALKDGRKVILNIDCFNEYSREDTFMKEHTTTMLLIYAYDASEDTFSVIERKYLDTLSYQKKKMKASEIAVCYEAYLSHFCDLNGKDDPSYFEFKLSEEKNAVDFKKNYTEYFESVADEISQQLQCIMQFGNMYETIIREESLKQYVNRIVANINDIINAKKVQLYKLNDASMFDGDERIRTILDNIIDQWGHLRNVLVKFMFTDIYTKAVKNTPEAFEKIYNSERELLDYMMQKMGMKA